MGNIVAKDIADLQKANSGAVNAANNSLGSQTNKYISFTTKPAGTTLKDGDLYLAYNANKQNYYLACNKPFDKEGNYEVKIVLDNGNYVTIPFEVKEFQTPVQLKLSYDQESVELGGTSVLLLLST